MFRPSANNLAFATNASERVRIDNTGNVGIGEDNPQFKLDVNGDIGIMSAFHASDVRWKKNIETIPYALDKVLNLRGVSYEWRTDEFKEKYFAPGKHIGVIAQEVEKVIPEVVITAKDGYKSVGYANLTALLIESVKELKAEKDAQQQQIAALEARLIALEQTIGMHGAPVQSTIFGLSTGWPFFGGLLLVGLVLGQRWRRR